MMMMCISVLRSSAQALDLTLALPPLITTQLLRRSETDQTPDHEHYSWARSNHDNRLMPIFCEPINSEPKIQLILLGFPHYHLSQAPQEPRQTMIPKDAW